MARHWIAGLLKHLKALTAICCPTVNCYRRLHIIPTPNRVDWGYDDRLATVRVKADGGPSGTYIENRLPASAANPYLVLAATVAAGVDGLVNRLECPPARRVDNAKGDGGNESVLPNTLPEALAALEEDSVVVEALGKEFVTWFVRVKRELEVDRLQDTAKNAIEAEQNMYLTTI